MVASGVSMAGGAYLSSKSQREVYEGQLAREAAEIEAMPELERAELVKIYRSKGLTPAEAETIVGRITSDKKVWLETQAREELGLDVAQFENPTREALVAGISTLVGGVIPVLGYLLGRLLLGASVNGFGALVIAFVVSAVFLFGIGSARSFFTGKGGVRSGLEMLAVGSAVAALTYGSACCSAPESGSAGRDAAEVGDAHHPRGAGKDHRFAPARSSLRVEVSTRKKKDREHSVDEMQQLGRPSAKCESGKTDQPLHRGQAGHDQVAGPKPAGHLRVAKVAVGAPDGEHEREHEQGARAEAVEEYERLHHAWFRGPARPARGSSRR